MLTVEEALAAVLGHSKPLPARLVTLPEAEGCVLAEAVVADLDLPPFDKALMDGFAVRSADCEAPGRHLLTIGEEITAGRAPTRPLSPGEAAAITTGAPLPDGADAVVMHEKTELLGDGTVSVPGPVRPGEARLVRGREMTSGQTLFEPGAILNAAKLGVLASVGKGQVRVVPRPKVAIVPTGDELVPIAARPGPGQIRETNSTVLAAMVRKSGEPVTRPPARDEPDALRASLAEALAEHPDVLLVCGGVSAGKKDLVPDALRSLGVRPIFHKVRLKPGKPLLFGVRASAEGVPDLLVFGLPGNPVSGIVGFLLFVAPALRSLRGLGHEAAHRATPSILAEPFRHRGDRPTYHPARLETSEDGRGDRAFPLAWAGSADLLTVARADGFLRFPEGDRDYEEGQAVDFVPLP